MNIKKPTKRDLETVLKRIVAHKNERSAAAASLGINYSQLKRLERLAGEAGFIVPPKFNPGDKPKSWEYTDAEMIEAWQLYERYNYNYAAAAEATGSTDPSTMMRLVKRAIQRFGYERRVQGAQHAAAPTAIALPAKGNIKRFILTCAQNNTQVHLPTWRALMKLAEHYDAEIKISTFTYIPTEEGSQKRGKENTSGGRKLSDRWYAAEVVPYISDDFEELAPGLVWCGHSNTLPTAVDPLSGVESFNGRRSGIFPHTTIAMRPVPTMAEDGTKFNWTTGAVTLRNYIQKRAGIRAEFHHAFGAALVEVEADGTWYVRQLNADSEGTIFDLDIHATPEGVWQNDDGDVEAITFGDIHVDRMDMEVTRATWGRQGMVELLKPRKGFLHDVLDFGRRGHHTRKRPDEMFRLWATGKDSVIGELKLTGNFIDLAERNIPELFVIPSNHHDHFDRWLIEADWRHDLPNAEVLIDAQKAMLACLREDTEFDAFAWSMRYLGHGAKTNFLSRDASYITCKANGGGIENALHGDMGPNGARATPANLGRIGRKVIIGHTHSPGIWQGVYVAGTSSKLRMGYNKGPSSWAHAHVVTYRNGKRQVVLIWKGKWRA